MTNRKFLKLKLKETKCLHNGSLVDSQELSFEYKKHEVKCYFSFSEGSYVFWIHGKESKKYVSGELHSIFGAAHKAVLVIDKPQLDLIS